MKENHTIREYNKADKATVLNLLRLNTPRYFSPEEEHDLIYYLEHEIDRYFLLEMNHKVVGCGGINFSENNTLGKISWDFFHPDFQGKGLGTLLLKHRIDLLQNTKGITKIIVRTSQHTHLFYEKGGFVLTEIVKNYWAEGYDLYTMEYLSL